MYYAWALHPHDNGHPRGNIHIVTENPITAGRLRRQAQDALCKPASSFWRLSPVDGQPDESRLCSLCKQRYDRMSSNNV